MEDLVNNANNGIAEQEESTGSVPNPLFSVTKPKKRIRSKVWDDFIPTFVDRKLAGAECMHCHRVFNCSGTTGLRDHLARCSPGTQKRHKQQEHTSLPSAQKNTTVTGSDLKQKTLPVLLSSQRKCTAGADATPVQKELVLPDAPTNNQEVDQNGPHEELTASEQKNIDLPGIPAEKDMKNRSHQEIVSPEKKDGPTESWKNQEIDQDASQEELIRILAMHGYLPRMTEQDEFRKLIAWLTPTVKMASHPDLIVNTQNLFQKEKSKLKEKLTALRSRVCLSAYLWHYDPVLAFLCLRVHYIDDEWEKQENIIAFRVVDSSCNAKELSDIILEAISQWGLDGKIFSIILDDAFIDDSVASNVKTILQERNPVTAERSLFVVRSATHLLDQIIQVGLDELDKSMEKLTKCSKYTNGDSTLQYPNYRHAPTSENWKTTKKICDILEHLHSCIESRSILRNPASVFHILWDARKHLHRKAKCKYGEAFSNVLEKITQKFEERWKLCFLHFCMPMIMDPKWRLERIKDRIQFRVDKEDYFHEVHDTLLSLFNEYSDQVEGSNCTSGSKTSKGTVLDKDMLMKYYNQSKYQYSECWKVCFLHFCMPMVMDPKHRIKHIRTFFRYKSDNDVEDYIQLVHDTLVSLFNEYSDQMENPDCSTGSKTSKGTVVDGDTLIEYYVIVNISIVHLSRKENLVSDH
ncbi:hypothetical protein ACP70R_006484 [Stipagrostis hirtigluma subsp. patula]